MRAHSHALYPGPDTSQNQMLHRKVQENLAAGCYRQRLAVKINRGHVVGQRTGGGKG